MATSIGTENEIGETVKNLIVLEHDAIAAYESTIERLDDKAAASQVAGFLDDHRRHLATLEKIAGEMGVSAPDGGDMKQYLTTGKIAMADLAGDGSILKAMKTNEDDTVAAYEQASNHADAIPATRSFFTEALADEQRHRAWMETEAQKR